MTTLLVDANNLMIRAFFSHPDLRSPTGDPTGAVFGVANRIREAVDAFQASRVVAFWDGGRSAWRRRLYPGYKNRPRSTDAPDLSACYAQKPIACEFLSLLGVDSIEVPGVEADDLIARAALASEDDSEVLSTDRDFWQLVRRRGDGGAVSVFYGIGKDSKHVTHETFDCALPAARTPEQWLAYRVVNGDASDAIPGARGLSGEKRWALVWDALARMGYAAPGQGGGDPVRFFVDGDRPASLPPGSRDSGKIRERLAERHTWAALGRNALLMDLRYAAGNVWADVSGVDEPYGKIAADIRVSSIVETNTTCGAWDRRRFERLTARLNFASVARDLTRWVETFDGLDARKERVA